MPRLAGKLREAAGYDNLKKIYHEPTQTHTNNKEIPEYKFVWFVVKYHSLTVVFR